MIIQGFVEELEIATGVVVGKRKEETLEGMKMDYVVGEGA